MSIVNGTYFIEAQTGAYVALSSDIPNINLTTWHYDAGTEQQWVILSASSDGLNVYTVQNVKYGTYITYSTSDNPGDFVAQSTEPYTWFVEEHDNPPYGTGLAFSSTDTFTQAWNVDNGGTGDNNPVIMFSCCDIWNLTAAPGASTSVTSSGTPTSSTTATGPPTASASSKSGSSSNHVGLIVGLVVGLVGGLSLLAIGGWFLYKHFRQKKPGQTAQTHQPKIEDDLGTDAEKGENGPSNEGVDLNDLVGEDRYKTFKADVDTTAGPV